MAKPQGNGASQLVQLMRLHGHNKDITFELGTVTSAPPEVSIRLDSVEFDLDKSDLIFASRATESLQQDDRVIVACDEEHKVFYVIDKAVIY